MFKKITLGFALIAGGLSPAIASDDGLYVGGTLSGAMLEAETILTDVNPPRTTTLSIETGKSGGSLGLLFGYAIPTTSNLSFDIEMDGRAFGPKATPINLSVIEAGNNSVSTATSQIKHSLGISMRPGTWLTKHSKGYLVLGYRRGQVETVYAGTNTTDGSISYTNKAWRDGFEYGLGMQVKVQEELDLRLEATRSHFGNQLHGINGTSDTINSKIYLNQASLSLVYRPLWG